MAEQVSANPVQLQRFVDQMLNEVSTLETTISTRRQSLVNFVAAPGGHVAAGGLSLVNSQLPTIADELDELRSLVHLVRTALVRADGRTVNGVVTVDGTAMAAAMRAAANEQGLDIDALTAIESPVVCPLTDVETIPPTSGYVNDPVSTATGCLVIAEEDFLLPQRLSVLGLARSYASGFDGVGAFGRGWQWWTEVRLRATAQPDELECVGPDGAHHLVVAAGNELHDATAVHRRDGEHVIVEWGRLCTFRFQRWVFDDGRLVAVEGDFVGRTEFTYSSDGRLVALAHDSGRSIECDWADGLIAALRCSDGRVVRFEHDGSGQMLSCDSANAPRRYAYDGAGHIAVITDADGIDLETMTYDANGLVLAQRSAAGNTTAFEYLRPRTTKVLDTEGRVLSVYVHDHRGRVVSATDATGWNLSCSFGDDGQVDTQRMADGSSFRRERDADDDGHTTETLRWDDGRSQRLVFDARRRLVASEQFGVETLLAYDDDSQLPTSISTGGRTLEVEWRHGTPSRIVDADGVTLTLEPNADGTIAAIADGDGRTTRFRHHRTGKVAVIEHPDGATVRYDHDDAGRTTSIIDNSGARATIEHSPAGRLRSITDPLGATYTVEHDSAGRPARIIDPLGATTALHTDSWDRLVGTTLPDGTEIRMDLDLGGAPLAVTVTDRAGSSVWRAVRDLAGDLTRLIDPLGRTTRFQPGRSRATFVDGNGFEWSTRRDWVARTQQFTEPTGRTWQVGLTPAGEPERLSDGADGVATIEYTAAGRERARITPGGSVRYEYDHLGLATSADHGRGPWRFERDERQRVTRLVSPGARTTEYGYDDAGRVAVVVHGGHAWHYAYDRSGHLVRVTDPVGGTTAFEYNALGGLTSVIDPEGVRLRYDHDTRGRIIAISDAADASVRLVPGTLAGVQQIDDQLGRARVFGHDAAGQFTAEQRADGTIRTFEYDGAGRLVRAVDSTGPTTLWERDAGGDVTATVHFHADGTPGAVASAADGVEPAGTEYDPDGFVRVHSLAGWQRRYERDERGLIIAVDDEHDGRTDRVTFRRDAVGRIIGRTDASGTTEYSYDRAGRLIGMQSGEGTWAWQYDRVGRLALETTPFDERAYTYDAAGQLTSVSDAGGVTRHDYDAVGRRIRSTGADGVTTYSWSEDRLAAVVGAQGERSFGYDRDGLLSSIDDQALAWRRWPLPGRADAPPAAFAAAFPWGGGVTDDIHPFGGPTVDGLVWLGERVYDTATRQFLSPDPLPHVPGEPTTYWAYAYAGNSPLDQFDPNGTNPISREEFDRLRDRYTGVQWGNVAFVVLTVAAVAVTVATAGTAGPLMTVVIGAAAGGVPSLAKELTEEATGTGDEGINWSGVIRDTVLGGVTAGAATKIPFLNKVPTSRVMSAGQQAAAGAGGALLSESLDAVGVPGGDGEFNPGMILLGGATGAAGGAAGYRPAGGSTSAASSTVAPHQPSTPSTPATHAAPKPPATPHAPAGPQLPIKGNASSNYYHVPGSRYYDSTIAEATFATIEEAEKAGFVLPPSQR